MKLLDIGGSSSRASSKSFVDPLQQPFLDFVRNLGMDLTGQNTQGAQDFAGQAGASLFGQGQELLGGLTQNDFLSALQQQAGGNQQLVGQQIGQLESSLGRAFNQQVLPGIRRDATAVGALGGSRQGVQEGIASQGFADAFSRGATDIMGADAQRSLQAGTAGAGIFTQGSLGGLSQLSNLMNTGMSQFTGGFAPLSIFADILGGPTVLDESKQKKIEANIGFG
jgi:hypothetical protein